MARSQRGGSMFRHPGWVIGAVSAVIVLAMAATSLASASVGNHTPGDRSGVGHGSNLSSSPRSATGVAYSGNASAASSSSKTAGDTSTTAGSSAAWPTTSGAAASSPTAGSAPAASLNGTTDDTTEPASTTSTPTTTAPTPALRAAPIGTLVAVATTPNAAPSEPIHSGVYVLNADGSGIRELAGDNYYNPIWTPDGRFVILQDSITDAIVAVPYAGGPTTQLARGLWPALSPDGTLLAYSTFQVPGAAAAEVVIQPLSDTKSALVDGGPATQFSDTAYQISWSPDGEKLVYGRFLPPGPLNVGPGGDLIVSNPDGSDQVDLLAGKNTRAELESPPLFSPDGSTIEFASYGPELIDPDGQNLRQIDDPNDRLFNLGGNWANHHDLVAVITSDFSNVWIADATGAVVADITITNWVNNQDAYSPVTAVFANPGVSFDPTDQYIYYSGEPGDGSGYSLYRVNLSGGDRARLTPGLNFAQGPVVYTGA
jgi:hypothetical protein